MPPTPLEILQHQVARLQREKPHLRAEVTTREDARTVVHQLFVTSARAKVSRIRLLSVYHRPGPGFPVRLHAEGLGVGEADTHEAFLELVAQALQSPLVTQAVLALQERR